MQFTALEFQVLRTIREYRLLDSGDHVLVAVSGGADSMALLLCLHEISPRLNLTLTVAHLNHGIRGREAEEDEDFVRRSSAALGRPFVSESADLASFASRMRKNLEEAAREARYEFLERAALHAGANRIATGHNLDDQAETILMRLLRGSGLAGLSGMQPVTGGRLIRPLLECSRRQILEFLAARDAAYREDSTNRELRYRRNRLRRELIPYLEEHFNPRLVEVLTREAGIAHAACGFLQDRARLEYAGLNRTLANGIALPAQELLRLHPALRHEVVRVALRELLGSLRGIESVHVDGILRLCEPGRSGRQIELPAGARARRDLEMLKLSRESVEVRAAYRYDLAWPGSCLIPEAAAEFVATILEQPDPAALHPTDSHRFALLDPDRIPTTLTIRSRLPGDHYGGPGHRKVKRMLLGARIPLPERSSLPMVAVEDTVIWVPGFPPARSYGATPGSRQSVLLECRRPAPPRRSTSEGT